MSDLRDQLIEQICTLKHPNPHYGGFITLGTDDALRILDALGLVDLIEAADAMADELRDQDATGYDSPSGRRYRTARAHTLGDS